MLITTTLGKQLNVSAAASELDRRPRKAAEQDVSAIPLGLTSGKDIPDHAKAERDATTPDDPDPTAQSRRGRERSEAAERGQVAPKPRSA